jgi:PAS domain S-box-containing protein
MDAALARGSWDLVISDYAMPRFSGLAALKLLQDKELDLPFIMVSGSAGENVAVDAMKAGAHHYILKDNLARLAPAVERELREAESRRERKRAESRYRNLFNTVPVGVFMNTPEGKVIEANPWFVAMLGFDDQESLKRINVSELWKRPGERAKLYALLARDGVVENFEAEFRRPDGACLWCVVSAHVVYNADGKIDHYEGVSVDITERKRAEQELSRARDAALEGVRIKSEFMSNMSHEIRTPLNGIMGMNELLLTSGLNPEQFQCAKTAVECGGLLTAIVNDILDFSKLVEGKMIFEQIDFDLSEVFENTIESFAEKAHSKDLELIPAVAGGVPAIVSGDPTRLRQVLNNLIGNALKFNRSWRGGGQHYGAGADPREGDTSICGPRHRNRYPTSLAGRTVQPLLAGRCVNHPQVRWNRSRPYDLGQTGRGDEGKNRLRKCIWRRIDILPDRGLWHTGCLHAGATGNLAASRPVRPDRG